MGLYYLLVAAVLLPWLLLFGGALRLWRQDGERLLRLQVEGAALSLLALVSSAVVFAPLFDFVEEPGVGWPYWFSRGETGLFSIGLLLLIMGHFLARPPGGPMPLWSSRAAMASGLGMALGAVLGILLLLRPAPPEAVAFPWSLARIAFMLGFYPYAISYFRMSRKPPGPPVEAAQTERME